MDLPMDSSDNVLVVTDDFQYYIPNLTPTVRQVQQPQQQQQQHQQPPVSHQNALGLGTHLQLPQSSQPSHLPPLQNMQQHTMIGSVGNMRPLHPLSSGLDMGDGLQMLGNICMQTQQENIAVPRNIGVPRTVMQQNMPGQSCSYTQMSMNGNTITMQPPQVNTIVTQAKDHGYSRNMMQQQRDNLNYQNSESYKAALMIMNPDNVNETMTTYQTVQLSNINLNINTSNNNMIPNMNNQINTFNTNVNQLSNVNTVNSYNSLPQSSVVTETIDNCQLSDLRGQYTVEIQTFPKSPEDKGLKKKKKRKDEMELGVGPEPPAQEIVIQASKPRKKGSGRKSKVKLCHFCQKDLVDPDKSVLFRIGPDGKSEFLDTCNGCLAVENAKIAASRGDTQPVPVQTMPVQETEPLPVFTAKVKPQENICQVCSKQVEKITSVIAKIENGKVTYLNACRECSFKPKPEVEKEKKKKLKKKKKKLRKLAEEAAEESPSMKNDETKTDSEEIIQSDGNKILKTIGTQVDENPYKWKCSNCKKIFGSKNELQKHRRQNHRYYRLFQCDQCDNKIKIYSSTELVHCVKCGKYFDQTHYSPYTLSKQFYVKRTVQDLKCKICQKEFSSRRGVLEHQKIHTNVKPHLCNVCGKTFRTLPPLRIHMRVHTGEKPYKCEMCGKCFRQSSALNMHVRHHTGETPYACQICTKKFARRSQFTKHMESHTEKRFECTVCNKKFPTEVRLKRHHRKHTDDNPYRCHICGMNYEENSAYRRHMQKHDTMNPYRCGLCGKQFGGRRGLMEHATVHQEGNEFKCGICGEEHMSKTDLDTHIQTHFIERPYKCQHCDLSFSTKSLLEHHTNFHANGEFFDCKKCGKKFTKRVTLDMHMRRHDGAKPFKCFICGEEYLWSTTLDSHMKTHYVNV